MASTTHLVSGGFSVRIMGMFLISLISLCSFNQAQALEINGGASLVNNPSVQLSLNLPEYCYQVQIRNEEGVAVSSDPSSTMPWTLSPGDGQKTVTVTYFFYYYYTYQCGTYPCGSYCCDSDWWGNCTSYCTTYCPKYCQGQASSSSLEFQEVRLDQTPPALSLTLSASGSYTNNGSLSVNGTCSDLNGIQDLNVAGVHVSIGLGDIYSITVQLNPGNNVITATAIDNAGNQSTASRSIIYDNTPPILEIDAVTSPTPRKTQIIHGTMEKGCFVSAECTTASIGQISYPTDNTWSGLVSNLTIGTNTVIVTAEDTAGNKTTADVSIDVFEPELGDFNVDQAIDLTDAILGMQVILGIVPEQDIYWESDVNGDNQIGLPDVIYILQSYATER